MAAVGGDAKRHTHALQGVWTRWRGQVTTKLQQTINLLDDMTNKYYKQENILQQMQEADREFDKRLRKLEQRGVGSDIDPSGASTTDTGGAKGGPYPGGTGPRKPSADTLREAKQLLQNLSVDLDIGEIFVPGIRRGYALIPVPDRPGEPPDEKRKRVQTAISRVRQAAVEVGTKPRGSHNSHGSHCRKAQSADDVRSWPGKSNDFGSARRVHRGGLKSSLETGSTWINNVKTSSSTAAKPSTADEAGAGWVDIPAIARQLGRNEGEVRRAWEPLAAELR